MLPKEDLLWHTFTRHPPDMAQPPQSEAADGGANMALLCAAQKLLCADAVAPAHPKNAGEAPMMETSSRCSCEA